MKLRAKKKTYLTLFVIHSTSQNANNDDDGDDDDDVF